MVYFQAFSIQFTKTPNSDATSEIKAGFIISFGYASIPEVPGTVSFISKKIEQNHIFLNKAYAQK
jgi:hypothetical protein